MLLGKLVGHNDGLCSSGSTEGDEESVFALEFEWEFNAGSNVSVASVMFVSVSILSEAEGRGGVDGAASLSMLLFPVMLRFASLYMLRGKRWIVSLFRTFSDGGGVTSSICSV